MRYLLLQAIQSERSRDWRNFCGEARLSVASPGHAERLAENIWLIAADDPWLSATALLHIARKHAISCRSREFRAESEWQDHPSPV
jgi:hypothetical protein